MSLQMHLRIYKSSKSGCIDVRCIDMDFEYIAWFEQTLQDIKPIAADRFYVRDWQASHCKCEAVFTAVTKFEE